MAHRGYREASRIDWGRDESATPDREQIQLGAILRIADALEKIAPRYTQLLDEANSLREMRERDRKTIDRLCRSNAALRGCLKRAKRKGGRRV